MKIAIDLGHGVGQDRGASSKYIAEETIIDNVGGLVINKLKALGHTVIEVRPSSATSVSNSLVQRVQKANNSKVDLYVSIHANAGGGKGTEVYTYHGKELQQARAVLNNLCSLGFNNRGIKGSNLFVTNHTNMTAMLIEVCFVDTQSDVELYTKLGNNKIADRAPTVCLTIGTLFSYALLQAMIYIFLQIFTSKSVLFSNSESSYFISLD